jgi:hypothetical protein
MPDYQPIDYRLRCHTKRTDLPSDVLRDIGEAYETIQRLTKERDEARRLYCVMRDGDDGASCADWAKRKGWDCFKENTND